GVSEQRISSRARIQQGHQSRIGLNERVRDGDRNAERCALSGRDESGAHFVVAVLARSREGHARNRRRRQTLSSLVVRPAAVREELDVVTEIVVQIRHERIAVSGSVSRFTGSKLKLYRSGKYFGF